MSKHIIVVNESRSIFQMYLYVPDVKFNLFSVGTAMDKSLRQVTYKERIKFMRNGQTEIIAKREDRMFVMQFKILHSKKEDQITQNNFASVALTENLHTWHERLAQQNIPKIKNFLKIRDIKTQKKNESICEGCIKGKIHRQPFSKRNGRDDRISESGELVHADLCGPMQESSINGSRYMLLFKNDYSRYITAYFIARKDDVCKCLKDFMKKVSNSRIKIKTLRTDNGLEFVNRHIKAITSKYEIRHQRPVAYTSEQNSSAEKKNRTIMEAVRGILHERNLPKKLWVEAANMAVYVINRTERTSVMKTPFKL